MEKMRILELFSGIGGMRYAADKAGVPHDVVAAVDISDVANKVYKFNFPDSNHMQNNICGLTAKQINKLRPNALLMSPPCQPFTRQGLQKDVKDNRTEPLLHILDLIPEIKSLEFILVENVKGFETSEARKRLVETISSCGFKYQEFLISPTQLGIPNSRLRYYLIAKTSNFNIATKDELWTDISSLTTDFERKNLQCFLEDLPKEDLDVFQVTEKTLSKHGEILDIVHETSTNSCCFTKAYSRYAEGTGSVLSVVTDASGVTLAYEKARANVADYATILKTLNLRYFTPREIANLLGFPQSFTFPAESTLSHRYRVLGNSLNVDVVSFLISLLVA